MSKVYSANQYEGSFKPTWLCNWEVPKITSARPKRRIGITSPIADERGHLLPSVPRRQLDPWGDFQSSWRLPKKIDRRTANKISGLEKLEKLRQSKKQSIDKKSKQEYEKEDQTKEHLGTKEDHDTKEIRDEMKDENTREGNKENLNASNIQPYVPGDFTEENRPDSYYELAKNRYPSREPEIRRGFPKVREDFTRRDQAQEGLTQNASQPCELKEDMKHCESRPKTTGSSKEKSSRLSSPILNAISNFSLAKKLHRENLEHQPLPDTVTHAAYQKLQMQRAEEPGLALDEECNVTGIGYKGYPGYGPTRCTKFKVFRPKTWAPKSNEDDLNSITSFDRRWRFIRQRKVAPMDLAICWDLTPEDPNDEPKPPPHIDGSNGSVAPAVFTLVQTPKDEEQKEPEMNEENCDGIHGCGPMFDHSNKGDDTKDFFFHRTKTPTDSVHEHTRRSSESSRAKSAYIVKNNISVDSTLRSRAKSAVNVHDIDRSSNSSSNSKGSCGSNNKNNVYKSTPNLNNNDDTRCNAAHCCRKKQKPLFNKYCVACELKKNPLKDTRPKAEYKMAFKAGVPQKTKACNREEYPEHFRLATVYQHSYKPMVARKRPLMQTIFK
ncbi:unnamed protein product [Acanthoscelides obtectus]|uniref:Cilia- and flagella-associated protein 126 n=2 Tax=Acanthoscelides obtectus TaxID=200917 RepID=A0A9P0PPI6_ACAOB|nr:unnamed protein product [Acanthoscelides obtectus]CAK1662784.1 Protein Flattop [Acanthoscelides obtectus]